MQHVHTLHENVALHKTQEPAYIAFTRTAIADHVFGAALSSSLRSSVTTGSTPPPKLPVTLNDARRSSSPGGRYFFPGHAKTLPRQDHRHSRHALPADRSAHRSAAGDGHKPRDARLPAAAGTRFPPLPGLGRNCARPAPHASAGCLQPAMPHCQAVGTTAHTLISKTQEMPE